MIKSLRWRLQLWYTALLLAIVGGFGSILYLQTRASKMQEIDTQLEAAVLYLEAKTGGLPPWELENRPPPPFPPMEKKGPKGGGLPFESKDKKGFKGGGPFPKLDPKERKDFKGPPPYDREQKLAELKLPRELDVPAVSPDGERAYFVIWRHDRTILKSLPLPEGLTSPPFNDSPPPQPRFEERGDFREVSLGGPRGTRIVVGRNIARERADLHAFAWQLTGVGALVLIIGLAGGFALASRIFRPIARMSAAASAISATNLSTRIDTKDVDVELAGLAKVLNAMFDRLEAAFERQQHFTADASHELRTPLAILRANAELALSQSRSAEEYRATIEACLRSGQRMSDLVQGLLTLARADAGNPGLKLEPVQFNEIVAECVNAVKPLAEQKKITLTADVSPATVRGDADSLAHLVDNLLSNAIGHNQAGGKVHVKLANGAVLTVADTGPGIAVKDRPHIFERFFRADKARARASGGTGLGLAICKAIVEAHDGTIDFECGDKGGTTFRVRLPLAV